MRAWICWVPWGHYSLSSGHCRASSGRSCKGSDRSGTWRISGPCRRRDPGSFHQQVRRRVEWGRIAAGLRSGPPSRFGFERVGMGRVSASRHRPAARGRRAAWWARGHFAAQRAVELATDRLQLRIVDPQQRRGRSTSSTGSAGWPLANSGVTTRPTTASIPAGAPRRPSRP